MQETSKFRHRFPEEQEEKFYVKRSQSRSWIFIFWRTFSLIKGSYFDQYHCGEPVISSKCEDTSGEETRESWLKLLFFTDDRPKTDCEDSATYLGSASTKRFVRFLGQSTLRYHGSLHIFKTMCSFRVPSVFNLHFQTPFNLLYKIMKSSLSKKDDLKYLNSSNITHSLLETDILYGWNQQVHGKITKWCA